MESVLKKAAGIARRGKPENAAQLLESEIYNYRDSFMFYYLLGLCYLYAGNYGNAHDYLMSARRIKTRDTNLILALAALYLRRGDSRRAVSFYLEAQEIEPKNRIAKKALAVLRKYAGTDDLIAWAVSGKIRKLYPPFPYKSKRKAFIIPVVLAGAALVSTAGYFAAKNYPGAEAERPKREGWSESVLQKTETEKPAETSGSWTIILTEKQILETYEKGRRLFNEHRDNAAQLEINRILESNANSAIKNKARILSNFLETPGFDTFNQKDNYDYADIIREPLIYQNCFVIWRGMAANIAQEQAGTSFDFLVGYDTRNKLEGIVRVTLPFATEINGEQPLEVLGKIAASGTPDIIRLDGVAIHQPNPRP
jgi:tetratricopeptide (TPR) repeat protein